MDYLSKHLVPFKKIVNFYREIPECNSPSSVRVKVRKESLKALRDLEDNGDIKLFRVEKSYFYQLTRKGVKRAEELYKSKRLGYN